MIALLAFALGAALGATLAIHLLRASRQSADDLIERFQRERRARGRAQAAGWVALTPLLYRRARELHGDGSEVVAPLERYGVDELALLRDFVRRDRELNERRAQRLSRQLPARSRSRHARKRTRAASPR